MRRRKRGIILVLLVAGLIVAVWSVTKDRTPDLLARATFLADTSGWSVSQWLDEKRILVVPRNAREAPYVLHTESRKRDMLPGLGATLSHLGSDLTVRISPDGRWGLVSQWQTMPGVHVLVRTEDGRIARRFQARAYMGWLSGGSGWMALRGQKGRVVSLFRPDGTIRDYPPASFTPGPGVDLAITRSEQLLYGVYHPYVRDPLKIHELDLRSGQSRVASTIGLPPSCMLSELAMSREQAQLSWQVRPSATVRDYLLEWLGKQESRNDVWVSRADGSDMRRVGTAKVRYGYDYDTNLFVEWVPGGNHLAVTLDQKLYKVPIE
jgi:hypothetical protein